MQEARLEHGGLVTFCRACTAMAWHWIAQSKTSQYEADSSKKAAHPVE